MALDRCAEALKAASSISLYYLLILLLISIQPLSLLLKASPLIDDLALYDVVNTPGVTADLSHISSPAVRTPTPILQMLKGLGIDVNFAKG